MVRDGVMEPYRQPRALDLGAAGISTLRLQCHVRGLIGSLGSSILETAHATKRASLFVVVHSGLL